MKHVNSYLIDMLCKIITYKWCVKLLKCFFKLYVKFYLLGFYF